MRSLIAWSLTIASAIAAPVNEARALGPSVQIQNGTVVGSSLLGIDTFNGIPFALPPTGSLRLKPPQSYNQQYPGGIFTATGVPRACPQQGSYVNTTALPADTKNLLLANPIVQAATDSGEDCLTLNVQRPSGTTSSSKLPVIFWIYGGGFEFGSTQMYDGSTLIQNSVSGLAAGHPVIYVAVNYRLAGFGFLAGKELQQDGSTNLGLRDQRLGLEWVAENIAAFGGDPDKVTIWGESAGSISVFDQTVINGGDNTYNGKALFRGAIMDSGSVIPAVPVNNSKPQAVYDLVVSAGGCSGAADTLACLRSLSYEDFNNAVNAAPGIFSYDSVDLAYLPRPDPVNNFFSVSPDIAVANGAYAKVPIIIGDQQDEGTLFSLTQSNISTTAQLITYIQSYFPDPAAKALVPDLVATYPDDPAAGSPFNTGDLNNIYPQYKRLAAMLGDITFTLTRRSYLESVSGTVPAWSYLDTHLYGTPVLGTFHATDILSDYYDVPAPGPRLTSQTFYTSFAYYLDPNMISGTGLISWPQYTSVGSNLLDIGLVNNTLTPDTFRSAQYAYLKQHEHEFRV